MVALLEKGQPISKCKTPKKDFMLKKEADDFYKAEFSNNSRPSYDNRISSKKSQLSNSSTTHDR